MVAFRNEVNHLSGLLKCLKEQVLNKPYEVILINDHSDDGSEASILSFIENHQLRDKIKLISLPDECFGKANAIQAGCHESKYEVVLVTDADCILGKNWANEMSQGFESCNDRFIIGMVVPEKTNNISKAFFSLDFISLTASGACAALHGNPFICNGANMAFTKSLWFKYYEFRKAKNYLSGDDVFFLHFVKNNHLAEIDYKLCPEAFVETVMPDNWFDFFSQRARWGGKANSYNDFFSVCISIVVLLLNVLLVISVITSVFHPGYMKYSGAIWLGKAIIDFLFLFYVSKFINRTGLLKYYMFFFLIYPFYIATTMVVIAFKKVYWKGRKVS
ncbi:MAG: glycosyltransferase [Bacteroidales bacterium]|nr:glycosyltransferase [Bacteroidales bacterium]